MAKIEVPDSALETAILRFLVERRQRGVREGVNVEARTSTTADCVYVEWAAYDSSGDWVAGDTDAYSWMLAMKLFVASADGEEDPCGTA